MLLNEEALAVVNGKKIYLSEFQNEVRKFLDYFPELRSVYERDPFEIKEPVIKKMIRTRLLLQEATRRRLGINKEDLDTFLANTLTPYTGANTESWLKNANLNSEEWKTDFTEFSTIEKLIQQEVNSKIRISQSEVAKYYKKNPQEFKIPIKHNVQHILFNSLETAELILAQLKKNRVHFEEAVRTHSISADKTNEGHLGFVAKGILPYELDQAVFKMKKIGSISPIIQSPYGFHIFKLLDIQRPRKLKLNAELKKKITKKISETRWESAYENWYDHIERKSNVTVDRNLLNKDQGF